MSESKESFLRFIPDNCRNRIQTEKDGLQYFKGKVRLLEMNHTPRHCGIFVESDISKVYSDNLLGKQTFVSVIGKKLYEDINRYCQQFGMSQTVNSVFLVGIFSTLGHWISAFIANKLEAYYVWLNADMLKFVDFCQTYSFSRYLAATENRWSSTLKLLTKHPVLIEGSLRIWSATAGKGVHILVTTSSDCKEASKTLFEEAEWSESAIFEHHPEHLPVRLRQLKLFLEVYYSNWSNISDPHIFWIVSVAKEKSLEEMLDLLKNAFDGRGRDRERGRGKGGEGRGKGGGREGKGRGKGGGEGEEEGERDREREGERERGICLN